MDNEIGVTPIVGLSHTHSLHFQSWLRTQDSYAPYTALQALPIESQTLVQLQPSKQHRASWRPSRTTGLCCPSCFRTISHSDSPEHVLTSTMNMRAGLG